MKENLSTPEFINGLLNEKIQKLLEKNEIKFCFCRKISDAAKHIDMILNEHGFSEKWDTGGLFSGTTRTIYVAEESWESGPHINSDEEKRATAAHEAGHAADLCLGRPSLSDMFYEAWEYDLAYNIIQDADKTSILGRLMEHNSHEGARELWAHFMETALIGRCLPVGPSYFPSALKVFNTQCADLDIPTVLIVHYIRWKEIGGKILDIPMRDLTSRRGSFDPPSPERPWDIIAKRWPLDSKPE